MPDGDVMLTPADLEIVFDHDDGGKPVLLVPTAAGKKKLIAAGLTPGRKLQLAGKVIAL